MHIDDFNKMYENVIKPMAEQLSQNIAGSEFICKPDIIYFEYQKQKSLYRLLCNKTEYNSDGENLLDRHKICAALCIALIRSNVICICDEKKMQDTNINISTVSRLNEQLAVAVSLEFLRQDMLTNPPPNFKKDMFPNGYFTFPEPYTTSKKNKTQEETYEDAIVRTVYFANLMGQLNLSLLAHIFFMVEKYHLLSLA